MSKEQDQLIIQTLSEKLTESLRAAPPESAPRRLFGRVRFPNKATAVIGMRRAGKTTFLHQLRQELRDAGVASERLPYLNLEDERLEQFPRQRSELARIWSAAA